MMGTQYRDHPLSLVLTGILCIICSLILLGRSMPASANSEEMDAPALYYPQMAGTSIDTCAFCHTLDGLHLNPYGKQYKAYGRGPEAFRAIEQFDSDGDGVSNIAEIQALTQPGHPDRLELKPAWPRGARLFFQRSFTAR